MQGDCTFSSTRARSTFATDFACTLSLRLICAGALPIALQTCSCYPLVLLRCCLESSPFLVRAAQQQGQINKVWNVFCFKTVVRFSSASDHKQAWVGRRQEIWEDDVSLGHHFDGRNKPRGQVSVHTFYPPEPHLGDMSHHPVLWSQRGCPVPLPAHVGLKFMEGSRVWTPDGEAEVFSPSQQSSMGEGSSHCP
jgi:hypothetical protein